MKRRVFLRTACGLAIGTPLLAAMNQNELAAATNVLKRATASGDVQAASLYVRCGDTVIRQSFGAANSEDAIFLLASISKPITMAAVMTLYDRKLFDLDDPVCKFLPEFTGDGRDKITIRHLMTHLSGLPDQLPENANLRAQHAELEEFVQGAIRRHCCSRRVLAIAIPVWGSCSPSEVVRQRISGKSIASLVDETVYKPLEMKNSALGVGHLKSGLADALPSRNAAPESGSGDPTAKDWNWNSPYWRKLGSPGVVLTVQQATLLVSSTRFSTRRATCCSPPRQDRR